MPNLLKGTLTIILYLKEYIRNKQSCNLSNSFLNYFKLYPFCVLTMSMNDFYFSKKSNSQSLKIINEIMICSRSGNQLMGGWELFVCGCAC